MFKLKNFEEIKDLYPNRENPVLEEDIKKLPDWLPEDYLDFVKEKDNHEYAGEFIFYSIEAAIWEHNYFIDFSKENNEEFHRKAMDWWVFAITGSGDHWLLSRFGNVFWHDHNSSTNVIDFIFMGINFRQWIILGDLMSQLKAIDFDEAYQKIKNKKHDYFETRLKPKYKKALLQDMNKISPSLKNYYPYRI